MSNLNYEDIILSNLKPEDLSEDMQMISAILGFDVAIQMMKLLGGTRLHIPKPDSYSTTAIARYIEKNKHLNLEVRRLTRDFNLSTNVVAKILKEKTTEK